ncbi:sprouty-related, EVH1 domain-containing protein 2 [Amblyraja radiata]|uniref:sprouty-related, EVH1 domain-containing protein 2 n=1 Tax=Amblyraja radiata TaxID=386614 RepID=UPI0014033F24|nr:sprouty-related, EVH1 domain-containing protein 2 [Amblyraja radiata]XP_032882220.1 sprouty-related, EVH1 domain-containing protein 2 [Amblyraja radiata]
MTEQSHPDHDTYIVRVNAVVMSRDDSGWLPQEGGGLSRVGVCKAIQPDSTGRSDFLILGERLKDKLIVLECFLKKDLVYTKATPTFHHWMVGNRKFGLTFHSPADARAFDRGVRKAIEDLLEGSTTSSSTIQNEVEVGDDDVFTATTDSSSNSSSRKEPPVRVLTPTVTETHRPLCPLRHALDHYSPDNYLLEQSVPKQRHVSFRDDEEEIVRINPREKAWLRERYEDYRYAAVRPKYGEQGDGDSYVHFDKSDAPKHDYNYPYVESSDFGFGKELKGGVGVGVVAVVKTQPAPSKSKLRRRIDDGERSRCVYCRDMFNHEENRRGQCQDAPDPIRTCIRRTSCMWCADSMLYHCMSDPEGDYSDPCSCDTADEKFCLRWLALIALSFIAPCICCYLPLRACYKCGVMCRCCGGKHKAVG